MHPIVEIIVKFKAMARAAKVIANAIERGFISSRLFLAVSFQALDGIRQ